LGPHCHEENEIRDTILTPSAQRHFSRPYDAASAPCLYTDDIALPHALLVTAARHLIVGLRTDWQSCPPVTTVPWNRIDTPDGLDYVIESVVGRFVFLGAILPGVRDTAETTYHAELPGVYMHALATEAMLSPQGRSARAAWWDRVSVLFVLFFVTQTIFLWQAGNREAHKKGPSFYLAFGGFLALLAIYVLLGWRSATALRDGYFLLACTEFDLWYLEPAQLCARGAKRAREALTDNFFPAKRGPDEPANRLRISAVVDTVDTVESADVSRRS
jgi:hypothetical protein